ncbi:hypothetical protein Sjap_007082 [Stephania japonica]|uniref:Large ribosomal subunit protein uL18c n=1 Tax=Stephania japonica TaxID=461633 RepID=A0AAP0K8L3_9MAGN
MVNVGEEGEDKGGWGGVETKERGGRSVVVWRVIRRSVSVSMSMSSSIVLQSCCSSWVGPKSSPSVAMIVNHRPSPPLIVIEARSRREDREARHARIRKKVEGSPERPRLCVFRSHKHMYVQVIDDTKMHTLASASTLQKPVSHDFDYSAGPTIEIAKRIGEAIAKSCLSKGITKVAFDRGGYPYHGRIQALADAAREHGLQF